jgi:uncharacterized protein (DUF1684 family)
VTVIVMQSDSAPKPTVLISGRLSLRLLHRSGKLAIRVHDRDAEPHRQFAGLEYFAADTAWRREGRLERAPAGTLTGIVNVLGDIEPTRVPGTVVFRIGPDEVRLLATQDRGDTNYRVMFKDPTNGRETYGAGRYVFVAPAGADGRVVLDFNRAFNPPCVFTAFATCPLPPPQNRLPMPVPAGERRYAGAPH